MICMICEKRAKGRPFHCPRCDQTVCNDCRTWDGVCNECIERDNARYPLDTSDEEE